MDGPTTETFSTNVLQNSRFRIKTFLNIHFSISVVRYLQCWLKRITTFRKTIKFISSRSKLLTHRKRLECQQNCFHLHVQIFWNWNKTEHESLKSDALKCSNFTNRYFYVLTGDVGRTVASHRLGGNFHRRHELRGWLLFRTFKYTAQVLVLFGVIIGIIDEQLFSFIDRNKSTQYTSYKQPGKCDIIVF